MGSFRGCSRDKHRNHWRCAKTPPWLYTVHPTSCTPRTAHCAYARTPGGGGGAPRRPSDAERSGHSRSGPPRSGRSRGGERRAPPPPPGRGQDEIQLFVHMAAQLVTTEITLSCFFHVSTAVPSSSKQVDRLAKLVNKVTSDQDGHTAQGGIPDEAQFGHGYKSICPLCPMVPKGRGGGAAWPCRNGGHLSPQPPEALTPARPPPVTQTRVRRACAQAADKY